MKKIKVIVEKTNTGYSAYTEDYPAFTTGANIEELKANMVEAMNLYFEETAEEPITMDQLVFKVDLSSVFELYPVINASALSKRVGMNKTLLSQYVNGKKKASEEQVQKIMQGIQEVGKELSHIQY